MAGVVNGVLELASRAWGAGWELRRRAYAAGLRRPQRVGARVVSIGNLTLGGTGKTTLVLHLARRARERGLDAAVVCRRYRPGPGGEGDEERMFRDALGESSVYAGKSKRELAARAASDGRRLVIVDDGFSHWGLERDLDLVLLDAGDPWGGRRLVPAGRLREPLRALQRAGVVVITRISGADPARTLEEVAGYAPAARIGLARHRVLGVRALAGGGAPQRRVRVVTATGNPGAVEASAREARLEVAGLSSYRDHHWFTVAEARAERERARTDGAMILLTAKDAVRWPEAASREGVGVLEVEWEWLGNSAGLDDLILGAGPGG